MSEYAWGFVFGSLTTLFVIAAISTYLFVAVGDGANVSGPEVLPTDTP